MSQDPRNAGPKGPLPEQHQETPGTTAAMDPTPDHGERTYRGTGRLKDRVALITGGDSGIGRAVAIAFAREGCDVAISYWNEHDDANETRRWVEDAGRRCLLLPGDLAEERVCRGVVGQAWERFQRLDILVNNAAFQGHAVDGIAAMDAERLDRVFRVNILAMFHLTRAALPHLKPGATVITTSSIQAYQPNPQILDYATTKGAIVTFTKGLSKDLIQRGVRANCVAPGPVWTPLVVQSYDGPKVAQHGTKVPMGRTAQPAEIAPLFVFLASDESRYINGEVVGITGGEFLG